MPELAIPVIPELRGGYSAGASDEWNALETTAVSFFDRPRFDRMRRLA